MCVKIQYNRQLSDKDGSKIILRNLQEHIRIEHEEPIWWPQGIGLEN